MAKKQEPKQSGDSGRRGEQRQDRPKTPEDRRAQPADDDVADDVAEDDDDVDGDEDEEEE